jgi:IclR family KDG regulon transcriptional repressor
LFQPFDTLLRPLSMNDSLEDTLPAGSNQSVTMSARILGELAASPRPLGVSEIARRLGESKARVFRHLATMKQCGLVSQEHAGDAYQLGWNIYRLGVAAANQFGLTRVAQRHMTKLRDITQETTALAIPASGDALVVGSVQSERQVAVSIKNGVVIPANSSALGRVILAFSNEETQQSILSRPLQSFGEQSIVEPAKLLSRLAFIRENYYEIAINENGFGIATMAAPVFDADNKLAAAVALVGSPFNITSTPDKALLTALYECAAAISVELDSTAWTDWRRK